VTPLKHDAPTTITVDAKLREILVSADLLRSDGSVDPSKIRRFCSAPSPDVFSVVAQSLAGGGTFGQAANPKSVEAALNLAFTSAEQGSTIPRTQTVNLLRELMFRTCERYLSGAYDESQVTIQAVRDQRLIVSILAIEQLTGVVAPKPVVVGATGSAGAGVSGEALVRLDDAYKAKERAEVAYAGARSAFDRTNGGDKVCDGIKGKEVADLTDDQKKVKKACEDARATLSAAESDRTARISFYQELASLARSGGVGVATSVTSTAGGGLDAVTRQSIKDVTDAVKLIVQWNFSDTTETMLFCMRVLQDKAGSYGDNITAMCSGFLATTVGTSMERELARQVQLRAEARSASDAMLKADSSRFERFWTPAREGQFRDPRNREQFAASLAGTLMAGSRGKAVCFQEADTRDKVSDCFKVLLPHEQDVAIGL
jgi:ethanolamine utilization microcompartment shell protein EutL